MTLISIKIQIITTSTQLVYQFKRLSAFIVYQMIKKYFRGKIDDYVVLDTTYCVFFLRCYFHPPPDCQIPLNNIRL